MYTYINIGSEYGWNKNYDGSDGVLIEKD